MTPDELDALERKWKARPILRQHGEDTIEVLALIERVRNLERDAIEPRCAQCGVSAKEHGAKGCWEWKS